MHTCPTKGSGRKKAERSASPRMRSRISRTDCLVFTKTIPRKSFAPGPLLRVNSLWISCRISWSFSRRWALAATISPWWSYVNTGVLSFRPPCGSDPLVPTPLPPPGPAEALSRGFSVEEEALGFSKTWSNSFSPERPTMRFSMIHSLAPSDPAATAATYSSSRFSASTDSAWRTPHSASKVSASESRDWIFGRSSCTSPAFSTLLRSTLMESSSQCSSAEIWTHVCLSSTLVWFCASSSRLSTTETRLASPMSRRRSRIWNLASTTESALGSDAVSPMTIGRPPSLGRFLYCRRTCMYLCSLEQWWHSSRTRRSICAREPWSFSRRESRYSGTTTITSCLARRARKSLFPSAILAPQYPRTNTSRPYTRSPNPLESSARIARICCSRSGIVSTNTTTLPLPFACSTSFMRSHATLVFPVPVAQKTTELARRLLSTSSPWYLRRGSEAFETAAASESSIDFL
mmetsp:Transcript_48629/g.114736  ORF Transcript_48629/g.114736 Transcript_48629/m.114736 type:complete len:462 (+) Transcript_48629:522-1907(+)